MIESFVDELRPLDAFGFHAGNKQIPFLHPALLDLKAFVNAFDARLGRTLCRRRKRNDRGSRESKENQSLGSDRPFFW